MYTLSPFVWRSDDRFEVLLRAVNDDEDPAKKVARIYYGVSSDGLSFEMDPEPALRPGPERGDRDGCEDPTAVRHGDRLCVYYSGWNQAEKRGALMLAVGPDACRLRKHGIVLPSTDRCRNPKEATVARSASGEWLLFFEYAAGDASRIGIGRSQRIEGPWEIGADAFSPREGTWDDWHLSPGPVVTGPGDLPLMFYNGASDASR
jgi:predicted GH43/DUF377 family glycosyl hydrolase